MHNDEHSDRTFADEACAHLDLVEPSAALLRRVASIPIEQATSARSLSQLLSPWPTRLLIFGSLALGASLGAIPLELADASRESALAAQDEATQDEAEPSSDEDVEFEDALALALGTGWNRADLFPEESH